MVAVKKILLRTSSVGFMGKLNSHWLKGCILKPEEGTKGAAIHRPLGGGSSKGGELDGQRYCQVRGEEINEGKEEVSHAN